MIPKIVRRVSCLMLIAVTGQVQWGCKEKKPETAAPAPVNEMIAADTPVLEISPNHEWKYQVTIENPKHALTGEPASASFERVRRYVGAIDPGNGKPPTDCFEVMAKGAQTMREYVKLAPEEVSITGQALLNAEGVQEKLLWFDHPIAFFKAGLSAGDTMPLAMMNKNKKLWRMIRVIGREKVEVPAGTFNTVRLQMVGYDEDIALRRTYWFCPKVGIIREEKVREIKGQPVFSETDELIAITAGRK